MNSCQNNKSDSTRVRKIIPIIIGSLLALAILFGAVLGTVALVREANSVVSYNGITVSRGVASYLASTYKATFISSLRSTGVIVSDAPFFWNKVAEGYEDTTYGDLLRRDGEKYIRGVLVRAYFFDRYSSLDSSAREWIDTNVKEVLDYKADGSIKKFNELSAGMGFTYDDFRVATELLYKAERAITAIYGEGGTRLAYSGSVGDCKRYLENYSHVQIIYIRVNDKFELDENGNRITEDGVDKKVALTDEERDARWADIAAIKASITAIKENTDGQMSKEYFNSFYYNSDGSYRYNDDPENALGGYYFAPSSAYTAEFREYYPEAVDAALNMAVGDFDAVGSYDEDGNLEAMLVLYKTEVNPTAYLSSAYTQFFTDFYSDAAVYLFNNQLDSLVGDVNVKDGYREIDVTTLEKNIEFLIR